MADSIDLRRQGDAGSSGGFRSGVDRSGDRGSTHRARVSAAPRRFVGMRVDLLVLLAAALALRLVFSLGICRGVLHQRPETEVTDGYNQIAENLAAGEGYRQYLSHPPTVERPPAYPVFLFLVFRIFGVDYVAVQVGQALLGALACWLLFLVGRRRSEKTGLVAAWMFALYPSAIEYSARLYSENLFFPLFFTLALFLCRAVERGSARDALFAGVAWGLGILTRGALLAFPLVLAAALVALWIRRSSPRSGPLSLAVRGALAGLLGACLVCAPWVVRNYRLTGAFIPVSTWGWAPWYHGLQSSKRMLAWEDLEHVDREANENRHRIVVERLYGGDRSKAYSSAREYVRHEKVARDLVLEEYRRDPLGSFLRALVGIPFTWFQTLGVRKRLLSLFLHLPLMILFVIGVIRMRREDAPGFRRLWPALLLVLFVNLFQAVVWPHARYMAPAVGLSFVFSAGPLAELVAALRRLLPGFRGIRRESPAAPTS